MLFEEEDFYVDDLDLENWWRQQEHDLSNSRREQEAMIEANKKQAKWWTKERVKWTKVSEGLWILKK